MIIAVDFDGTIVEHAYPEIGAPIPFAIDVLKKLQMECHHTLILWSVREGDLLEDAVKYCKEQGLVFYAVNKNYPEEKPTDGASRKLNADLFIDDRNIGGLPDWGVIYKMVKFNKPLEQALYAEEPKPKPKKKSFFKKIFS